MPIEMIQVGLKVNLNGYNFVVYQSPNYEFKCTENIG